MRCAWQSFINLLPLWMRDTVDKQSRDNLQELRLRLHAPPVLITANGNHTLERVAQADDLQFCVNMASRYSPWSAGTVSQGFITAQGGHRIGLCGNAILQDGKVTGIHNLTSLCIRIARDFPGIASDIGNKQGSVLIIGKPGSGKTTLLRDLIRTISNNSLGSITVVDEREEIFPRTNHTICFPCGKNTDILSGCSKAYGIEAALRNTGPDTIAVDEVTAQTDCEALIHAGWCGVKLLATAHAGSRDDLFCRPVYRPIIDSHLFDTLVTVRPNKSYKVERMNL